MRSDFCDPRGPYCTSKEMYGTRHFLISYGESKETVLDGTCTLASVGLVWKYQVCVQHFACLVVSNL